MESGFSLRWLVIVILFRYLSCAMPIATQHKSRVVLEVLWAPAKTYCVLRIPPQAGKAWSSIGCSRAEHLPPSSFPLLLVHLLQLLLPLLSTEGFFALTLLLAVRNQLHFTWTEAPVGWHFRTGTPTWKVQASIWLIFVPYDHYSLYLVQSSCYVCKESMQALPIGSHTDFQKAKFQKI